MHDQADYTHGRYWSRLDWFLLGLSVIVWGLVIPLLIWMVS